MSTIDKVVEYVSNGLSIHLLKTGEKRPVNSGWSKAPFATVKDLYEEFKGEPNANIGVRLGDCTKIGSRYLYAFDLDISSNDPKMIKEAHDFMRSVFINYTELPSVRSASPNSRHYYFLSKHVLKTKKLGHSKDRITVKVNGEDKQKNEWEIDLCSTGRQVVLPPSRFNGRTYEWEKDLLSFLNNDAKKALMIIDDITMINSYLEHDTRAVISVTETKYKIEEIKKYLDRLPDQFFNNYDEWLKVGMALHSEFDDTEDEQEAIQLFDEFSKKGSKYQKGDAYKKWKSFSKSENGVTLGTIFYHCPKETQEDKVASFSKFLNQGNVSAKSLRFKMMDCILEEHEMEMFIDVIASELSKTMGSKFSSVATRKLVKSISKSIKEDQEEALERLAIGLDDTLATMVLKENFNEGKHLLNLNNNIFTYTKGSWIRLEMAVLQQTILNGIKKIMSGTLEEHKLIRKVIFTKKRNDNMDGLTNNVTSLILKMVATPEHLDVLNLRNKSENAFSVVNTLNKEIYIQNGKMTIEDHKYDSYLITQFAVNYEPGADCPTWNLMLNNVFQKYLDKDEMIRHFCECLGYILQSRKTSPLFLILLGSGRNGKSFVMSEFSKIMGIDSTINDDMLKFSQSPHAEAALVGKNMLIDDDWKKGQLLPDDYIKKLSENKTLTANPKFKDPFNFVSRCTPVILSNSSPKTKDTSFGLERRAQVFDFNYQFLESEIDPRLGEKLKAERSGFFNMLLEHYIEFEKRGGFKIPHSCQRSIKGWLKGSNPLIAFLDEKVIITKDHDDKVKAQQVFEAYLRFTEGENFSHNMTRNNFYDDIKHMNGLSIHKNSTDKNFYIHGVKLKSALYD